MNANELDKWIDDSPYYEHDPVVVLLRQQQAEIEALKAQNKLIGWRTSDFLHETTDISIAQNWEMNIRVLPIFEGDINTKIGVLK